MKVVTFIHDVEQRIIEIQIDGKPLIYIREDQDDLPDYALEPLWKALGIILSFKEGEVILPLGVNL